MMTLEELLVCIRGNDYAAWFALTLPEKWHFLKDIGEDGRSALGEALGCFAYDTRHANVSLGAELNKRADPEMARRVAYWLR